MVCLMFHVSVGMVLLQQEESQLAKITRDSSKITAEQVHGLMSQVRVSIMLRVDGP